jgi:uncharacterized protein YndB with AHSA1/START domain
MTPTTKPAAGARAVITTPSEREIRVERTFRASRERVWRALTDPALVAQWWGPNDSRLEVERMEVRRGGHWRFVEHGAKGADGFEGRYREVTPPERLVYSFEWDGMPGHVAIETLTLEDLGDGHTRLVAVLLWHTTGERDGMLGSGMEGGVNRQYDALDRVLAQEWPAGAKTP